MKLTNMRIGKRLALGFGILSVVLLSISGLAWWGITSVSQTMVEALRQSDRTRDAMAMSTEIDEVYLNIWSFSRTRTGHKGRRFRPRSRGSANPTPRRWRG